MRLKKCAFALTLALGFITSAPSYAADWKGNDASMALSAEGNALYSQGKLRDALEKFQAAAKADPASSYPISLIANILFQASLRADGDNRARLRSQSEQAARAALRIKADNSVAQELLRKLTDDAEAPLNHQPGHDAEVALVEGEHFFARGDYEGARMQYELALQRDPLYAQAWLDAGDSYFAQKNWPEAESRFKKATELEPLMSQAWRFLSDAQAQLDRHADAEASLFSAIGAQPSQLPNWDKLAALLRRDGLQLRQLHLTIRASATADPKTKQIKVALPAETQPASDDIDTSVWTVYALTEASAKIENGNGKPPQSPFQIELKAWRQAMTSVPDLAAKTGKPLRDPALLAMLELSKTGQLEPAILLLAYREAYRPDFEAWKSAHPDGIRQFIIASGLRP